MLFICSARAGLAKNSKKSMSMLSNFGVASNTECMSNFKQTFKYVNRF